MKDFKVKVLTLAEARKLIVQSYIPEFKDRLTKLRDSLESDVMLDFLNPVKTVLDNLGAYRAKLNPDGIEKLHKETILNTFCERALADSFFDNDPTIDAVAIDTGDNEANFAVCYFRNGNCNSLNSPVE